MEWHRLKEGESLRRVEQWSNDSITKIKTVKIESIIKIEEEKRVHITLADDRILKMDADKFIWRNTKDERYFHITDTKELKKGLENSFKNTVRELGKAREKVTETIIKAENILITRNLKIRRF